MGESSLPTATSSQPIWSLPPKLTAQSVLPDRYTDPESLHDLRGKETDPGRMGIFVCLLDDRPHLHPTLASLHKHRSVVHGIPMPSDPQNDLPINQHTSVDVEAGVTREVDKEWLTWKFSAEEESRRRAFLPLA